MPSKIKPGKWTLLEGKELQALYEDVGLTPKVAEKTGRAQREKKMRPPKNSIAKPRNRDNKENRRGPRIRGR